MQNEEQSGRLESSRMKRHCRKFHVWLVKFFALLIAGLFTMTHVILAMQLRELSDQDNQKKQMFRTENQHHGIQPPRQNADSRRFPKFGTEEFGLQCNWTKLYLYSQEPDCIFYVQADPRDGQGIALWISKITSGYILARQAGCKLLFDYGQDVEIHRVLTPHLSLGAGAEDQLNNWTVPSTFLCSNTTRCVHVPIVSGPDYAISPTLLALIASIIGRKSLFGVPFYRYAYFHHLDRSAFQSLEEALPGFQLETGMACSLGTLFHLAPGAKQYEPELFSRILPKLQNESNLVIALYIRTGHTDKVAKAEKAGQIVEEEDEAFCRDVAERCVQCVLSLEEKWVSDKGELASLSSFSRGVWMLVTDSAYLKKWIRESYDGQDAANVQWNSKEVVVIPREVVVTRSQGRHTRSSQNPSTTDFAEALIDWYLLGESDLVVKNSGYSFGSTAALRTARPLYEVDTSPRVLRHHRPESQVKPCSPRLIITQ